jgi:crotonobetainyl-CoA:carnitine CoA-transferase CaiB-like acyl-CoA transferase
MGDPDWAKDPRFTNRTVMNNLYADEIDAHMESWLMDYTKAELLELALEHRIPLAPVRGYDEVRHEVSLADFFLDVERWDTGPLSFPGLPYILAEDPPSQGDPPVVPPSQGGTVPAPAPFLGQHNEQVYCGMLKFTNEQLVKLYQTGII